MRFQQTVNADCQSTLTRHMLAYQYTVWLLLQGKKIDTLDVGFTTNATVYDTAPTQSDISSEVTGTGNSTNATSTSCSSECALYNLTCAIKDKCYSRIGLFFGYIGIAMVVGEHCLPHVVQSQYCTCLRARPYSGTGSSTILTATVNCSCI